MQPSCPGCHKALQISEEHQGKSMKCPVCQQAFRAPMLSPPEMEIPDE